MQQAPSAVSGGRKPNAAHLVLNGRTLPGGRDGLPCGQPLRRCCRRADATPGGMTGRHGFAGLGHPLQMFTVIYPPFSRAGDRCACAMVVG